MKKKPLSKAFMARKKAPVASKKEKEYRMNRLFQKFLKWTGYKTDCKGRRCGRWLLPFYIIGRLLCPLCVRNMFKNLASKRKNK